MIVQWLTCAAALLTLLLLSACNQQVPLEQVPSPTEISIPTLPATVPTTDLVDAGEQLKVSGQFELTNTSTDLPEVLVESITMAFEHTLGQDNPWQELAASCTFVPNAPILVRQKQSVHYDCTLETAAPPGAELHETVEIRLLGSDEVFRLQVQQ